MFSKKARFSVAKNTGLKWAGCINSEKALKYFVLKMMCIRVDGISEEQEQHSGAHYFSGTATSDWHVSMGNRGLLLSAEIKRQM